LSKVAEKSKVEERDKAEEEEEEEEEEGSVRLAEIVKRTGGKRRRLEGLLWGLTQSTATTNMRAPTKTMTLIALTPIRTMTMKLLLLLLGGQLSPWMRFWRRSSSSRLTLGTWLVRGARWRSWSHPQATASTLHWSTSCSRTGRGTAASTKPS
jgi:hypothetical protein